MKRKFTLNEIRQDWKFCEIEKRGLQFLLRGSDRLQYEVWKRRPRDYKKLIRNFDNITFLELKEMIDKMY